MGVRGAFEPGRPSPTRLVEADAQVIARHRRELLVTEDKNDRRHGGNQRPKRASQMSQLRVAICARVLSDQQPQGGNDCQFGSRRARTGRARWLHPTRRDDVYRRDTATALTTLQEVW